METPIPAKMHVGLFYVHFYAVEKALLVRMRSGLYGLPYFLNLPNITSDHQHTIISAAHEVVKLHANSCFVGSRICEFAEPSALRWDECDLDCELHFFACFDVRIDYILPMRAEIIDVLNTNDQCKLDMVTVGPLQRFLHYRYQLALPDLQVA